jgi:predicted alpha/beta-fold hydrolase
MRPFQPLVTNPHLLTILGNFWPREFDFTRFPMEQRLIRTEPNTQVLVQTQRPTGPAVGEVTLLHGLEGAGDAGYIVSMAWTALNAGFIVHRFHMRTCGGTEKLCKTLYHGGLTSDLRAFLEQTERGLPRFLVGFSLGGNVSLKLAGELGETELIHGVCSISAPIDLGVAARRIGEPDNFLYQKRFVQRMKQRVIATGRYTAADLAPYQTLYEIDDKVTAPSFGFGTADNYYATQSSTKVLDRIHVPALAIAAKDDTFIPFAMYSHAAFSSNPHLKLASPDHGGHLGFLSRKPPRFWVDEIAIGFLTEIAWTYPQRTLTST